MHSRTRTILLASLLTAAVVVAPATAPAAATHTERGPIGDLIAAGSDMLEAAQGIAAGLVARVASDPADRDAAQAAQAVQDEFNAHNESYQSYVNDRVDADADADVLELTFDVEGETETVYLTADVNGSNYENATVDDTTDRTVDESCTLSGPAARNAADELQRFRETFVEEDRNVTRSYMSRLAAQYSGRGPLPDHVTCSFEVN